MMWTNRTDLETSAIIDRGVLLAQSNGQAVAWSFLAQHGISESSISRLLSPRRRPPVTAAAAVKASTLRGEVAGA